MAWVVMGFLFCPCHLPLTLAIVGAALAGSAIGALVLRHVGVFVLVTSALWIAATWRGLVLLRRGAR